PCLTPARTGPLRTVNTVTRSLVSRIARLPLPARVVAVCVSLLAVGMSMTGMWAAFTDEATGIQEVSSSKVDIGATANDLSGTVQTAIAELVTGDVAQRLLTVANDPAGMDLSALTIRQTTDPQ